MKQILCNVHLSAGVADSRARMNARTAPGFVGSWDFTTEPYTHQRPSGAPPG